MINDIPLFMDPFLLFNSDNSDFQSIHKEMIDYLLFLQAKSEGTLRLTSGMKNAWFAFSEVKQTWLGFSLSGNAGCGMGNELCSVLNELELADCEDVILIDARDDNKESASNVRIS